MAKDISSLTLMYLVPEFQRTSSKASESNRFIQICRHTQFHFASFYFTLQEEMDRMSEGNK